MWMCSSDPGQESETPRNRRTAEVLAADISRVSAERNPIAIAFPDSTLQPVRSRSVAGGSVTRIQQLENENERLAGKLSRKTTECDRLRDEVEFLNKNAKGQERLLHEQKRLAGVTQKELVEQLREARSGTAIVRYEDEVKALRDQITVLKSYLSNEQTRDSATRFRVTGGFLETEDEKEIACLQEEVSQLRVDLTNTKRKLEEEREIFKAEVERLMACIN